MTKACGIDVLLGKHNYSAVLWLAARMPLDRETMMLHWACVFGHKATGDLIVNDSVRRYRFVTQNTQQQQQQNKPIHLSFT